MGVVPAGVQVHQAGGGFGVAAGVLVGHQGVELVVGVDAAVQFPEGAVVVFAVDLAERAVAQAHGFAAVLVPYLYGAVLVVAVEVEMPSVGAFVAGSVEFGAAGLEQLLVQHQVVRQALLFLGQAGQGAVGAGLAVGLG